MNCNYVKLKNNNTGEVIDVFGEEQKNGFLTRPKQLFYDWDIWQPVEEISKDKPPTYYKTDEHKYRVGQNLWVEGSSEHGEGAFKAEVLMCLDVVVATNHDTGLPTIVKIYVLRQEFINTIRKAFESSVLADYDNVEDMKQYRGGSK